MLGEDPNKSSSHLDKQRLLPLLKKHIEEVITPKKQQDEFFSSLQPGEGKTEVPVNDMSIGDTFTVNGEKVEVVGINPDDDSVEVDGGKRFGRQHIAQDSVLGVDNYTKAKEAPPEPVQEKVPTLRPMQKSGDLFVDQSEDFALAGEKGIDHEKKAAEQALAKQTADEAARLQEKQQQPLFPAGEKPPEVPPVQPERLLPSNRRTLPASKTRMSMPREQKEGSHRLTKLGDALGVKRGTKRWRSQRKTQIRAKGWLHLSWKLLGL